MCFFLSVLLFSFVPQPCCPSDAWQLFSSSSTLVRAAEDGCTVQERGSHCHCDLAELVTKSFQPDPVIQLQHEATQYCKVSTRETFNRRALWSTMTAVTSSWVSVGRRRILRPSQAVLAHHMNKCFYFRGACTGPQLRPLSGNARRSQHCTSPHRKRPSPSEVEQKTGLSVHKVPQIVRVCVIPCTKGFNATVQQGRGPQLLSSVCGQRSY